MTASEKKQISTLLKKHITDEWIITDIRKDAILINNDDAFEYLIEIPFKLLQELSKIKKVKQVSFYNDVFHIEFQK